MIKTTKQSHSNVSSVTITDYLKDLEEYVTVTLPGKLESLIDLRERMISEDAGECFDIKDIETISVMINEVNQELELKKKEFQHKSFIYEDVLSKMDHCLSKRENILNESNKETNLFQNHPNLIKYFASKQADLARMKDDIQKKVYDDWILPQAPSH
jgi:transcriptional regulator of heat shock response